MEAFILCWGKNIGEILNRIFSVQKNRIFVNKRKDTNKNKIYEPARPRFTVTVFKLEIRVLLYDCQLSRIVF